MESTVSDCCPTNSYSEADMAVKLPKSGAKSKVGDVVGQLTVVVPPVEVDELEMLLGDPLVLDEDVVASLELEALGDDELIMAELVEEFDAVADTEFDDVEGSIR